MNKIVENQIVTNINEITKNLVDISFNINEYGIIKTNLQVFNNKPDSILFPLVEYILKNTIEKTYEFA